MAGGALAGLAAAYPGYLQGRQNENAADMSDLKLDEVKKNQLAKVAMGNALALLGGQGGGPQAPPPGQPSQPMMQPGQGGPPGGMPPPQGMPPQAGTFAAPGQGGGMPPVQGGPPPGVRPPMMPQTPGMMQPPMMPQSTMGQPPMGGGMPPGGGMQPGGQGQPPGMGRGAMDWRQLVQAVKQANPNLPPEVMAEAVNQFLPLMNANSQQEWRNISLQMREQSILQREQLAVAAEAGRNTRAGTAEEGRTARATTAEEGRETRSSRSDTRMRENSERQGAQFQQREARLEQGLKLREDSTWARLEQQKEAAAQRVAASQGRQGLAEWKAAADAQDKHVRTRIQAYSQMNSQKPKERAEMLKAADDVYNAQMEKFREQYGSSTPRGGVAAPGAPEQPKTPDRAPGAGGGAVGAVPVPPAFAKEPDGTKLQKDGRTYVKRGDQLVPEVAQ